MIDIAEQAVGGFLKGTKLPLGDGVNGDDEAYLASFPYAADPDSGLHQHEGRSEAVAPAVSGGAGADASPRREPLRFMGE